MMSPSKRLWAGILAVLLLPVAALAFGNDGSASSNNNAVAATTSTPSSGVASAPAVGLNPAPDPLLQLLLSKGILTTNEVNGLASAPANQMRDQLLFLLTAKGVLSTEDLNTLKAPAAAVTATSANASLNSSSATTAAAVSTAPADPQGGGAPAVVPAIAPIRVLQTDPPKREGFVPDISIGKNIRLKPYGFFKASAVYDTSSPYGNDFPLPGFNPITNGPDNLAEFRVRVRATRVGTNFEWLDIAPSVVLTGKVEFDFEGNFSRANNRNISSIRSNMPSLRLAYARLDHHVNDQTTVHALFGQDWTPFASSTLPNLFETTGFGIGFGTLYERAPQMRFGLNHKFAGD